jgi:hypothetical protein
MSKISGSSKEKSIRETLAALSLNTTKVPPGWRTKIDWTRRAGLGLRTFEGQLARLMELGHAKKQRFINERGEAKWYYWINKLSDEDHD